MMKFIFFMIFIFMMSAELDFFLISNLVLILGFMIMFLNFCFTDQIMFGLGLSMDMLSYSLILLSFWVIFLMFYSSSAIFKIKNMVSMFSVFCLMLMLVLMITFLVKNLLTFYFFFEVSLVPTLLIILGWGYQPERLQAGIYFLFYTLTASLPLLVSLLYLGESFMSLSGYNFEILMSLNMFSFYLFLGLSMAFLVKMPMFFTHLWLPKAHVEAPVAGSMILAGVLLKLGGYGFYRVFWMSKGGLKIYGGYAFGLSIMGMVYVGLICCRLNDMKALVAYSSVAHMGLVISGVFTLSLWGLSGGLAMMVSHGLASSGLFCLVNMFYERSGSRSIYINKGLIIFFPLFSLMVFLLSAANMAAPPTINLMSEIFLMVSMLKFDSVMLLLFPMGSYLGVVFTLFFFSYSQHGKLYMMNYSYYLSQFREFHLLVLHLLPVNFFVLKSEWIFFI